MPFPDCGGRVAGGLQGFREGLFFEGQVLGTLDVCECLEGEVATAWDPVGQAESGWVLSGQDARAGRGAHMTGCVCGGESHALLGQAIDVRGFVEAALRLSSTLLLLKGPPQCFGK